MQNSITLLQSFAKCKGTASRIQTIFDYHYDAILREVNQELQGNPDKDDIMDLLTELMEDAWPVAQGEFTTDIEENI